MDYGSALRIRIPNLGPCSGVQSSLTWSLCLMLEKMLWFQESSISFLTILSLPGASVWCWRRCSGSRSPASALLTWSLCLMLEKMLWFQESSISFLPTLSLPGASVWCWRRCSGSRSPASASSRCSPYLEPQFDGEDALVPGVQHQLPPHALPTWSLCLMLEKMLWFQESSISFLPMLSLPGASVWCWRRCSGSRSPASAIRLSLPGASVWCRRRCSGSRSPASASSRCSLYLEPLFDVGEDALVPGVQHQLPHQALLTWSLCLMLEKMLWFQESSISFLTTLSSVNVFFATAVVVFPFKKKQHRA